MIAATARQQREQDKTAMNGGRSPQADAHVWGVNLNPYERAYINAWESYYGKLVPHGYVVHHMLGDGPHGIDPLFLVAMPRGLHAAMHNRERASGTLELPRGWVVVGGVLVPVSEASATIGPKGKKQGVSPKGVGEPKAVGIADPHPGGLAP